MFIAVFTELFGNLKYQTIVSVVSELVTHPSYFQIFWETPVSWQCDGRAVYWDDMALSAPPER